MKSKWSKVLKTENRLLPVELFEMTELIPFSPGYGMPRLLVNEEEPEIETPHDCSALQRQAFQSGHDAGLLAGRMQSQPDIDREIQRVLLLTEQLEKTRDDMVVQAEADLVELSFAIARKIIQREVSVDPEILVECLQPILKSLSATGGVCLKVHPDDISHLQTAQSRFSSQDGEPLAIHLEADESVGLGGCTIHTEGLDIDASIEQQIHRISEALIVKKEPHGSHVPSSPS